jgi:Mn2+/Fe2+ NRAMP family transporter
LWNALMIPQGYVDFLSVIKYKERLFDKAFDRFEKQQQTMADLNVFAMMPIGWMIMPFLSYYDANILINHGTNGRRLSGIEKPMLFQR